MSFLGFILGYILYSYLVLRKDFSKTEGFLRQKVLHVIGTFLLFSFNITSFRYLFHLSGNFLEFYEKSKETSFGIIAPEFNFIVILISNILGVVLFVLVFSLLNRRKSARKLVVRIIPFAVLTSLPSLYELYLNQSEELIRVLALVFISIFILVYAGLFMIYQNKNMKEFFTTKQEL